MSSTAVAYRKGVPMKGIIHRRRNWKKYDGSTYYYFSMATRKRETISKESLWELSQTLPVKVKETIRKIDLFKVPMTPQEQTEALTLCSLSLYCFNGLPKMDLMGISMEDYSNDFYIEMVKTLRKWNPEKGPWVPYVKYVRLHTLYFVRQRWQKMNDAGRVSRAGRKPKEVPEIDWKSLQELGTPISEGHQVVTKNV